MSIDMKQIHVTLRKSKIKNNRLSLYLDFFPPVFDPVRKIRTRREFLGLHIYETPSCPKEHEFNQLMMIKAENTRSERELQFLREEFGILDKTAQKMDFLEYFRKGIRNHSDSDGNRGNWKSSLKHLEIYTNGNCRLKDINEEFCRGFQEYLKTAKTLRGKGTVSTNTQLSYYSKLKACIKDAMADKLLKEDPSEYIKGIKKSDSHRGHLSLSELKRAGKTPFPENETLKKAALFSALTGLRWSDIAKLCWREVIDDLDSETSTLNFKQKKTEGLEYLPISKESRALLGERCDPGAKVFTGLKYSAQITADLKSWLTRAEIHKHITFHCFRHSYATIQLTLGTDIYTVSKTLGHKHLKTTEIYAKVVDSKKREAAERISLL